MKTDIQCTIFDEDSTFCLRDLCRICRVRAEFIHDLVDEGILSPQGQNPGDWHFGAIEIKRIQISIHLQKDLRVNLPGTALALDLLDEIEDLRRSKAHLEKIHELK